MPPMTANDCPPMTANDCCRKDVRHDRAAWRPEQETEHNKAAWDAAWNRKRVLLAARPEKKPAVYEWEINVRRQYEPAKRVMRFYRLHHRPRVENAAARRFYALASEWKNDTMHWSSVTRMIAHPNYLRIIRLAGEFRNREVEKLILEELMYEPDHWFDALVAITGENPVGAHDDFDQSVEAWLEWGRQQRIILGENYKPKRA
jgi:hypothetical protein